jgi:toxin ParE1/3/4
MGGSITWTEEAERWLRDIHDYIALDNPAAAQRTVQGIYQRAQVLTQLPEIGYLYAAGPCPAIRILLYGHYRIAYRVQAHGHIQVLGVFHGALDIDRYLS